MANFTLIVNPSSDGQTTLTSVPTDFDYAPILPSATSLASLVAEPTGDEFTYSFSSAFSGTESGGQPPSPTESTGGSGNTRKVGLPLTLFLCVMALGNIVILIP